jgi:tRNA(fMet)-specific endonuclease VapC
MIYGCELLAESKRKIALQSYLTMVLQNGLTILPYDQISADCFERKSQDYNQLVNLMLMVI